MVILFSERKSRIEKEIIEILTFFGADYISDKVVYSDKCAFTMVSEYKRTLLKLNKGIAVFCDNTTRFLGQLFPEGTIGICEDTNTNALSLFQKSNIPVITCGMNSKNTITISSYENDSLFASLQRTFINIKGNEIEPEEFKIKLNKKYEPFSVMASVAILLLNGIIPKEF